jgi:hypothetical protein
LRLHGRALVRRGRWFLARAEAKPQATFRLLEWLHWVWLILGVVTVAGAVAGTHGLLLFE